MNMTPDSSRIDRYVQKEVKKELIKSCLVGMGALSIVALDENDEVVGVKLGHKITREDKKKPFVYSKWMDYFTWAMPSKMVKWVRLGYYMEKHLRYHPSLAMEDIDVSNIFIGEVLGVSPKARGLGLGKEMMRLSMELARKHQCEAYFACVSGIYSQKIYHDLGFKVLREMIYAEVIDHKGRVFLKDTREHTKAQIVYLKL